MAFPLAGNIIGPLLVWLARRDVDPDVRVHGASSVNFQITLTLMASVGGAGLLLAFLFGVGFLLSAGVSQEVINDAEAWATVAVGGSAILGFVILYGAMSMYFFVMVLMNTIRAMDGRPPKYWPDIQFVGK
jgi:uncharacterized Tic20 family protein